MNKEQIVKQLRDMAKHPTVTLPRDCEALKAAADLIEQAQKDHTYGYAKHLAETIFKQHFASDEHYASGRIVWGVNDTVIGILTQIDNMVADMVRKSEQAQKPKEFSKVFALMKSTDDPCTEVMAVGQLMKEWLEVVVADAGTVIDTGKGFSEFDLWVQCEGKELFITIEEKRPTK
jgi:hypothetical protein